MTATLQPANPHLAVKIDPHLLLSSTHSTGPGGLTLAAVVRRTPACRARRAPNADRLVRAAWFSPQRSDYELGMRTLVELGSLPCPGTPPLVRGVLALAGRNATPRHWARRFRAPGGLDGPTSSYRGEDRLPNAPEPGGGRQACALHSAFRQGILAVHDQNAEVDPAGRKTKSLISIRPQFGRELAKVRAHGVAF